MPHKVLSVSYVSSCHIRRAHHDHNAVRAHHLGQIFPKLSGEQSTRDRSSREAVLNGIRIPCTVPDALPCLFGKMTDVLCSVCQMY